MFNINKITAFEVTSYSAIKYADLQSNNEKNFLSCFLSCFPKLFPDYFQIEEQDTIKIILENLIEPKSANELASIISCSTRTLKDKYLDKMLLSGIVAMTIPDKPTSSKQKYKLVTE